MTLAQPQLPNEPLGVGASWRTRWNGIVRATPVVIEATWTVRSLDEAATVTGVAEQAVLRVEFTRRVADDAQVRDSQRLSIEASGSQDRHPPGTDVSPAATQAASMTQEPESSVDTQPASPSETQVSVVHARPSSQTWACPPEHPPEPSQASFNVQTSESSQGEPAARRV